MAVSSRRWTLQEDGDSLESGSPYTVAILESFPAYEAFWAQHIVPLTRRDEEPPSRFVRPNLHPEFNRLADVNYGVFFHLTHCHYWTESAQKGGRTGFPTATEGLYCYFSHLFSLLEATRWFALRVNQVVDLFADAPRPFATTDRKDERTGEELTPLFNGRAMSGRFEKFDRVCVSWRPYRNFLVHNGMVFVQSRWMPTLKSLPQYSGLAAISRMAGGEGVIGKDLELIQERLPKLNQEAAAALDPIWAWAKDALDWIEQVYSDYRTYQREVLPGHEELDLDALRSIRDAQQ